MSDDIIVPITISGQSVSAPVSLENTTVSAPVVVSVSSVSAPLESTAQVIDAPVHIPAVIPISAPVQMGVEGPQGPQGVPGPTGGISLQYIASVPLGGHRMVVLDDAAQAIYADNTTLSHVSKVLGMTTGAANALDLATIQTGGEITEPSWSWALNTPIFLGATGLLTQVQPVSGFSLVVAFPITQTKIFINLREPIILT